jgi:hypothetical protein
MAGNTTSLYATTSSSGNVTIPSNNNTGLYNTSASPASTVNTNVNVNNLFASGNIYATGTIQSGGNMSTGGSFTAAGNVTAQNFIGNFAGNISGNVAAAGSNTQVQYNNSNALGASANLTFNNTTNLLSVTGNVAATYFQGNGSQLTGLPATYGNSNVITLLASFGSNTISTTGNVSTGYVLGNGSQLTGIVSSYSNANVANYLPIYSGSLNSVNNITASGNVTALRFATSGAQGNIVGPNYVSANYFVGDGSLLTNLPASSYGNANVNTLLAAWGSNTLSTTGNISAGYLFGNGSQLTGITAGSTYSNANVVSLLASFGSNTISTSGNVTAGYFVGNGSLLTSLTGGNVTGTVANATYATSAGTAITATNAAQANYANIANSVTGGNVTGSVAQANYANTANSVAGGNVSGQVANALIAGTVYTAAQPNITSVGTLTTVTVTGNTTSGNILTGGQVSAVGNITGAYIFGNGSQLTGLPATYGNSNVTTLLASFGSNTISTTGNVNVGNLNVNGQIYDNSGVLQLNAVGNIVLVPTGTTVVQSDFSATGNVTGNYFIGNGSQLSGIVTSAGGSNTQIQFNNGNTLAGNGLMTFNNTTGTIGLGNLTVNTNTIQTNVAIDLANANIYGTTTPWRILMGNAYNGTANSIYSGQSPGTIQSPTVGSRLLVSDFVTIPNTGVRFAEQTNYVWANLSANIANTGTRLSVARNEITIGGGTSAFGITATNTPTMVIGTGTQVYLGAGTNANLSLVGNIVTTAGTVGTFSAVNVNNYSTANLIIAYNGQLTTNNANATVFGNATTQLGYTINFGGGPANANITGTTTAIGYYMPGFTANTQLGGYSATSGNIARQATNYYSFRSDDTLAKAQLGSLSSFNEFTGNITSSAGSLTIDKSNGQVQQIYPTENITAVTFSNFVTRVLKPDATYVNQSDTVTLIIQQGATPRTVTMPIGTAYRYAAGVTTVPSTANTSVMLSITGTYNYNTAADQYLITISPGFA